MRSNQRNHTTDIETLRFLALCENEPSLWNSKLDSYKNPETRHAAAERIADLMDMEGVSAQQVLLKFENLKAAYALDLKRVAENPRSVVNNNLVFSRMSSFLKPHVEANHAALHINNQDLATELSQACHNGKIIESRPSIAIRSTHSAESAPSNDEFDLLGNLLAVSARKLKRTHQMRLKRLVLEALIKCEEDDLID